MKQAKPPPSSMITAVIRVTSVNETVSGVVSYNQADLEDILNKWSISTGLIYWLKKHDADEDKEFDENNESKEHFHIVIQFKKAMPFKSIKDALDILSGYLTLKFAIILDALKDPLIATSTKPSNSS